MHSRELIWMEVFPPRHLGLPAQPGLMVGLPHTSPITSCGVLFSSSASVISGISTSALSQQSRGFSPCRQRLCSWRRDGDASVVASFPFTISSVGTCFHDSRGVPSECLVRFLRKILPKFETNPLSVIHRTLPFSG